MDRSDSLIALEEQDLPPQNDTFDQTHSNQESDLVLTPPILLFPGLTWLYNSCCRRNQETLQQEFMRTQLPSVQRCEMEDEALDRYIQQNNIPVAEENELKIQIERRQHKPQERLGFGTLAMFRTMRFLGAVMALMAIMMLITGIQYYKAAPQTKPGFGLLNQFSLGNIDYSYPVCIHQYSAINLSRRIDCKMGREGSLIGGIVSTGIVPQNTTEKDLSQCLNVQTDILDQFFVYVCSTQYLNNATLVADFNQNCKGKPSCEINLSSYVQSQFGAVLPQCLYQPAQVYIQYHCYMSDEKLDRNKKIFFIDTNIAVFAALTFVVCLIIHNYLQKRYMERMNRGQVLPAAFTCKLEVTEEIWQKAEQRHRESGTELSLHSFFVSDLQDYINGNLLHITRSNSNIAVITLIVDGGEKINRLIQRGFYVLNKNSEKSAELYETIKNLDETGQEKRPELAFITFTTIDGFIRALEQFGDKAQNNADDSLGNIILKAAGSPHSIQWENIFVPLSYRIKAGLCFSFFFLIYLCAISWAMAKSRYEMENVSTVYGELYSCFAFEEQFAGNEQFYSDWAKVDMNYMKKSEMIGYYQCYCLKNISWLNVWQAWTNPDLQFCQKYVWDGMGATLATAPCGILSAILVNIGALIIQKTIPLIRFHSRHKQNIATMVSIFLLSYASMGISVTQPYLNFNGVSFLPDTFTPAWLLFYGKMFRTQLIMFNFLPYLGPALTILWRRGICCCRRKNYKPNTHLNSEFSMERRYATILTSSFMCFQFGFAIPMLFVLTSIIFLCQYVIDKLLVTYYYKERVEHNDFLNRIALKILKYGIIVFLFFSSVAMQSNYCSIINTKQVITYFNEYIDCSAYWREPLVLIAAAIILALFQIGIDIHFFRNNKKQKAQRLRQEASKLADTSYFSRLSDYDRKRWLCEEHYCRSNLGIQTLSDASFSLLCKTPGRLFKLANDVFNYDILSNQVYMSKIQYVPLVLTGSKDEQQYRISCQITRSINGCYAASSAQGLTTEEQTPFITTSIQ